MSAQLEDRLEALPERTRRALLLTATAEPADRASFTEALELFGGEMADLHPAEEAGLVLIDAEGPRFEDPGLRAVAYDSQPPAERRAAHRALAAAAPGPSPWHGAAAAEGPDAKVAAELADLAEATLAKGDPAAATDAFERAAQLSPDDELRFGFQLQAGIAAIFAGQLARSREVLDSLLAAAEGPLARADVQRLRAGTILLAGHPMEAHELLLAEADRVEELDPARASALLVDAGVAQMASGDMSGLIAIAERAAELAHRGGDAEAVLPKTVLAEALAVQGRHAEAREIVTGLSLPSPASSTSDPEILAIAGLCLMWIEDYERSRAWLDRMIAEAREAGARRALPMPLSVRACLDIRGGHLPRAEERTREAVEIAEAAATGFGLTFALSTLAYVAAWRGDAEACRTHAERALEIGSRYEMQGTVSYTEAAFATLEMGKGRTEAAIDHSLRSLESSHAYGRRDPSFLQDGANIVEACAREGRTDDARAWLGHLEAEAELTGGIWAAAAVARCRGILAEDDGEADAHFAEALRIHDSGPEMPLERARTQLCHGERLRRGRRRAEARIPLAAAERAFGRAGARAWAERARQELAATGPPASQAPAADGTDLDLDVLTPQEREICQQVAEGARNREIAAALYISPRTVEYHLGNAYRKLDVRSRTELTAAMLSRGG
ncbi:MAG TPA: LuxR C-terminal-related transcriptional regulator [Solirubrobacterales bacterium]|nr:LuxR C-terminal-related transcriptional regulator [Solirubrobacterales bacterium]